MNQQDDVKRNDIIKVHRLQKCSLHAIFKIDVNGTRLLSCRLEEWW